MAGHLTPVQAPQATAQAILDLLNRPDQWQQAAQIGPERVRPRPDVSGLSSAL